MRGPKGEHGFRGPGVIAGPAAVLGSFGAMPAYVIAYTGDFRDAEALQEYRHRNTDAVASHGGRFLARGGAVDVLEGPWPWERCVVMEFPDADAARAWHGSAEYAPLKAMRQAASTTQIILVEGV